MRRSAGLGFFRRRDRRWMAKRADLVNELTDVAEFLVDAGESDVSDLIDLAAPGGRVVFFGATRGNGPAIPLRKIFWRQLTLLGTTMGSPADWAAMIDFVARHRLTPVVSEVFPLTRAAEAFALMERGGQFGKIVVTM